MAVAETAAAQSGKSVNQTKAQRNGADLASGSPATHWMVNQWVGAFIISLGLAIPVSAQIIADPTAPANQRPIVLADSNGRPIVNIQTPSAAGVSRNTYSQFDIQANGVILNNSRASNMWLATGEAKVILNEVNSNKPSLLKGQVAVGGSAAQVVIANPSGLSIDGASFVNASRVTLTTGAPVVSDGALQSLRVDRGTIDITGKGLNVQGVPYTEILSRAATLSASVRGNATDEISVITGPQAMDYASGGVVSVAPSGAAPVLSIDASALGSMYAGRISLLSTEAGVGVRNAGALQAASLLLLTAEGHLTNTGSLKAPAVSLGTVTGDVIQAGQLQASNTAMVTAGGNVRLSGAGMAQAEGSVVFVDAKKGIDLAANASVTSNAAGGSVSLSARENVQLGAGSVVNAAADVQITSDSQVSGASTQLGSTAAGVTVLAGDGIAFDNSKINAQAIHLESGKAFADTTAPIRLNGNTFNSASSLTVLATGTLSSTNDSLKAGTHLHLGAAQEATLTGSNLNAGSIEMIGKSISATDIAAVANTSSLKMTGSAGSVSISGNPDLASNVSAATDLQVTALGGDALLAAVEASADHIKVNATGDTKLLAIDAYKYYMSLYKDFFRQYGFLPPLSDLFSKKSTALSARKSLSAATVGVGKTLSLENSSLTAGSEDISLISAGSVQLGTATATSSQGSVSVVSGGAISGVNTAALRASQNLSIDAGEGDLTVLGGSRLSAGQDLSLVARKGSLSLDGWYAFNRGSMPSIARDLSLTGASVEVKGSNLTVSRDITITSTIGNLNFIQGVDSLTKSAVNPSLSSRGRTTLSSAGDITGVGLSVYSAGDLRIQAMGGVDLAGSTYTQTINDGFWTGTQQLINKSRLSSGGSTTLYAGNYLLLDSVDVSTRNALSVTALGNISFSAGQEHTLKEATSRRTSRSWTGKKTETITYHKQEYLNNVPVTLAGQDITVKAGNNLNTYATQFNASGKLNLEAGDAINYYAVSNQQDISESTEKKKSWIGIRYDTSNKKSSAQKITGQPTQLQSQYELFSTSGGNQLLQGTKVSAGGGYVFAAGVGDKARSDARITLEGVKNTVKESEVAKNNWVVWQKEVGSASTVETLALPSFAGGGTFTAPGGLSVQIPAGDFKNQIETLSAQPGMEYLNALTARTDVKWEPVKLAFDKWEYKQEGLTPAGAALLGAAVAWATGGVGAKLLANAGVTTTATTSVMANAAFTSLAQQASILLVNNKGNIGKTLKDLGKSSVVKSMLTSIITAGVMDKLGNTQMMKDLKAAGAISNKFSDKLTYNLINATGRAVTETALNGGSLEDSLKAGLLGAMVETAHGDVASKIGEAKLDYISHKVLHALAGCVAGAASGGACKDGAIGGAVGEIVAQTFKDQVPLWDAPESEWQDFDDKIKGYGKLVAGAVSAYAGGDPQTAMKTAETAIDNNQRAAFRVQAMQQGLSSPQFYMNLRADSLRVAIREAGGTPPGTITPTGQRVNYTQSDILRFETQLAAISPQHPLIYSRPSSTVSPLPASYVEMSTAVNMNNVVGASSTTAFGFNRDSTAYFRELMRTNPHMFSQSNRDLINKGIAPRVDSTWIQSNPTHQSFSGTTLVHHHWMQSNIAVAIPQPVHQQWSGIFHPYR